MNAPVFVDGQGWIIALVVLATNEVSLISIGSNKFDPRYPLSTTRAVGWFIWTIWPLCGMVYLAMQIFFWPIWRMFN